MGKEPKEAQQVLKELKVSKDSQGLKDQQVPQDQQVLKDLKEPKVLEVLKGPLKELKEHQDLLVQQELKV